MAELPPNCNVCAAPLAAPLYDSGHDRALTSLCQPRRGRTLVWACGVCGHLRGAVLPDTDDFYAHGYRILLDRDDEDQIYEMRGGDIVYRTAHQLEVLQRKLPLAHGARLLDYGCAKASTPRALVERRPDLQVHLFDVSDMYVRHWAQFVPAERCALRELPADWAERFDVVTSFFALEHVPDPREAVRRIASLLRDDGLFYAVVPDTFGNPADLVVIDHVNHFTSASLQRLLADAGFGDIDIDADAHRGAWVVTARKNGRAGLPLPCAGELQRATALARFWSGLGQRLQAAEALLPDNAAVAIYGSGFYGAWIASTLTRREPLRCFLDRSPFQQGKTVFELPVLAPEALPQDVSTVFVGLNPKIARSVMAEQDWMRERRLKLVFLDDAAA